jgi:predicted CxxxxCH...CXXCH cytochrome family protein
MPLAVRWSPAVVALGAAALLTAGCGSGREVHSGSGNECLRCHGSSSGAFLAMDGSSDTTQLAVGAHGSHVYDGIVHAAFRCDACHLPPHSIHEHLDDPPPAEVVVFGALAQADGARPIWDRASATCSGVYCHGATLDAGGSATAPVWTRVDGSQRTCGSCHGFPPTTALHPRGNLAGMCHFCHDDTLRADDTVDIAAGKHIDGIVQASGACNACHPDPGGAHAAHGALPGEVAGYGVASILEDTQPAGGPDYAFGCGQCHPFDFAKHLDGVVEVELTPAGAPDGTLRARNAADAGFDRASGTCAGAYCHSSGQATPGFAATPAWTAGASLPCSGCHGNPPRYATGGAASATANSHLGLADDGFEYGHFAGLPGPFHGTKHGGNQAGEDAAPITCQTCHADTVDPAAAGPSGFYWLDTTGDYQLPGGKLGFSCASCHTGVAGAPPQASGAVLPLRHVNGRRDVVFDPRTTLPAIAWLPAAPNTPTLPYWVTGSGLSVIPPDVKLDGTTLSLHLGTAAYDPATKTCTNVGCHLVDQPIWGRPYRWLVSPPETTCCRCHGPQCGP